MVTSPRSRDETPVRGLPSTDEPPHGADDELDVVVREPLCAEPPLSALNSWITPNNRYFIRSHFAVPRIDALVWRLVVDGEVERPLTLSFEELCTFPVRTVVATMECAGNSRSSVYPPTEGVRWKNGALGTAQWKGVSLLDVLERAGLRPSARDVVFEGADRGREPDLPEELRYAMSVPIAKARNADTLVAFEMNGEPLSPSHGFPARIFVPGWYGMASVKWVTHIEVLDHSFQGYYRTRQYTFIPEGADPEVDKKPVTSLLVKSVITWPEEGATLPQGIHTLRGFAWSGESSISRVEVTTSRIDGTGGEVWETAALLEPRATHAWVQWEHPVNLSRQGYYVVRARATDDAGNTQPLRADWNFRGVATNSVHAVPVIIRRESAE